MRIDGILEKEFGKGNTKIVKKIQAGMRCETYLIESNDKKMIFQVYLEGTIYQAKKKYEILQLFNNNFIPKTYKYYEGQTYSYLITEYIEGDTLNCVIKNDKVELDEVFNELSATLSSIHEIDNNVFGWITNNEIVKNSQFIDYIKAEYYRLVPSLEQLDEDVKTKIINCVNKAMKTIEDKTENIKKSCLCWYDINPDNVLVKKNNEMYELKGILDPGGARYGIKEWDLAFIKMELCRNKNDFNKFIECYKKNSNSDIDMELIEALTKIVELDDISIRIIDKVKLPIPYESSFREEIEIIEKM